MSQFIELKVIINQSDLTERTRSQMFNKSSITNVDYDDNGHIWITYEGEVISCRGDYETVRDELLKD